jgi:hypothetical protein
MALPEVTELHADRPILFRFQTYDSLATITVSIPANPTVTPKRLQVPAQSVQSLNITDWLPLVENSPPNTTLNKGVRIESDQFISVYYEVFGSNMFADGSNSDIFTLKGRNALGTYFVVPFQQTWDNREADNAFASFDIVATENETVVEILPAKSIVGHLALVPIQIRLQKGQTWSGRSVRSSAFAHPSGTVVRSNKPIAITIKDDSMVRSINYDLGGDQIVPVRNLGTEYIVIQPINPIVSDSSNIVTIVATESQTQVDIFDGQATSYNLTANQSIDINLRQTANIRSNHPIAVLQTASYGNELGQCLIPPIRCTGSKRIGFFRSNDEPFQIALLTRKGSETDFKLNGQPFFNPLDFQAVPGQPDWVYYIQSQDLNRIAVNTPYIVSNTGYFHLATYNGESNTGFRFGYFSDAGFVDLGQDTVFCKGQSIELDGGIDKDRYTWSPGNQTTPTISIRDTGLYIIEIQKLDCIFKDSIHLSWPTTNPDILTDTFQRVCVGDTLKVKANSGYERYRWSNGITQDSVLLLTNQSGNYRITIQAEDSYQCQYYDTLNIESIALPTGYITTIPQHLNEFCTTTQVTLEVQSTATGQKWFTGETTPQIQVQRSVPDLYFVQLTDTASGCKNTIRLEPDCSVFIEVPNLITLNSDGKNDQFIVKYLPLNYYSLEVYNTWGARVHDQKNFNNDWNTEGIPPGVYYIQLTNHRSNYTVTQWLHIIR